MLTQLIEVFSVKSSQFLVPYGGAVEIAEMSLGLEALGAMCGAYPPKLMPERDALCGHLVLTGKITITVVTTA
jgi:hypothetical protein